MKTMAGKLLTMTLLACLIGLWGGLPGNATLPISLPQDTLAGLIPGINTVADASRLYGVYDVRLPGDYLAYAGGTYATNAYRWTTGTNGKVPGLIVETAIGSPRIDAVVVDEYPGLPTANGLMALDPEQRVIQLYGLPDYAYELYFGGNLDYRELFYVNRGLLVVLEQINGRMSWMVSRLVLTYPTYLRNAVAVRTRAAIVGPVVTDITDSYQVWVRAIDKRP